MQTRSARKGRGKEGNRGRKKDKEEEEKVLSMHTFFVYT
jgi:hypothetical protein